MQNLFPYPPSGIVFTNQTTGSSGNPIQTSALTQVNDLLILLVYLVSPLSAPAGWTLISSSATAGGNFAAYWKIATVSGTHTIATPAAGNFGTSLVIRVLAANTTTPILTTSSASSASATTFTAPSTTVAGNFVGVLLMALAEDPTLQAWTTSPSLKQQASGFSAQLGQMKLFYTVQQASGASLALSATKAGSATAGYIEAFFIATSPVSLAGPMLLATQSAPYSSSLTASGGTGPYTYAILTGTLPTGLSLNASTGAIIGTPSVSGEYCFFVQATDSIGQIAYLNAVIAVYATAPVSGGGIQQRIYWLDQSQPGDASPIEDQNIWTGKRTGINQWTTPALYYSILAHPPSGVTSADIINGISVGPQSANPAVLLPLTVSGGEQLYAASGNVVPIVIDASGMPDIWNYFTTSQGPYNYPVGSNTWSLIGIMSGPTFGGSAAPSDVAVYQSTNYNPVTGAGTWIRKDQAHEPLSGSQAVQAFDGNFDGSNKFLRFVVLTSAHTYSLIEFDQVAGTWGAFHDPITVSAGFFNAGALLYSNSAATTHFFYTIGASSFWSYLNLGTWTTVNVTSTNISLVLEALLDPNGTSVHTFSGFSIGSGGRYQQFQAGGVIGPSFSFPANQGYNAVPGKGGIFTDPFDGFNKIVFPVDYNFNDDSFTLSPGAWIGYPLSAPNFGGGPENISPVYFGDQATCTASPLLSISAPAPPPPTLACPITSTATVGIAYNSSLVETGGTGPFTYAIISGSLPPGFVLNPSTGAITGTTTIIGTFVYTAQVTDSTGATAQATCSILVSASTSIPGCPSIN